MIKLILKMTSLILAKQFSIYFFLVSLIQMLDETNKAEKKYLEILFKET